MNELSLRSIKLDKEKIGTMLEASARARDLAEMTVITDEATYEFVSQELMRVKDASKAADKDRKEYTKPLDDLKKAIMDAYRPIADNYKEAEAIIKTSLQTFAVARERERQQKIREYEEALRKKAEAEALQKKAEAEAHEAQGAGKEESSPAPEPAAEPAPVPPIEIAPPKKLAGATIVKTKKARVIDTIEFLKFAINHPDFLGCIEIKESALNKMANAAGDSVTISGVEIYEDVSIAAR